MTTSCAIGHYCPPGTIGTADWACPAGTFTNSTSLVVGSECTPCPARFACLAGTDGTVHPLLPCAAGYFCPQGTQYQTQYACPAGKYSAATNLTSSSGCTQCPAGSFCVSASTSITGSCAAGFFCLPGSGTSNANPCAAGTYTASTSATAQTDCLPCPVGRYCIAGTSVPAPCPTGSYSNVTGATAAGPSAAWPLCVVCPAGYACAGTGVGPPTPCGNGFFSAAASAACSGCPAGAFCDTAVVTDAYIATLGACGAGLVCSANMARAPVFPDDACLVGFYCPRGAPLPIACPPGTFNSLTGQGLLSNCLPCPAGSYCLLASPSVSGACAPGYYCPMNSTGPLQVRARMRLLGTMPRIARDSVRCMSGPMPWWILPHRIGR